MAGKELLLYSDIQKTRTQELHVRLSAMVAIYSPGIVQSIKREERNLICTVSSMSITAQLQYCPNCRRIARIFSRPEIKTITEKVSHVTAKTVPPEELSVLRENWRLGSMRGACLSFCWNIDV